MNSVNPEHGTHLFDISDQKVQSVGWSQFLQKPTTKQGDANKNSGGFSA